MSISLGFINVFFSFFLCFSANVYVDLKVCCMMLKCVGNAKHKMTCTSLMWCFFIALLIVNPSTITFSEWKKSAKKKFKVKIPWQSEHETYQDLRSNPIFQKTFFVTCYNSFGGKNWTKVTNQIEIINLYHINLKNVEIYWNTETILFDIILKEGK